VCASQYVSLRRPASTSGVSLDFGLPIAATAGGDKELYKGKHLKGKHLKGKHLKGKHLIPGIAIGHFR